MQEQTAIVGRAHRLPVMPGRAEPSPCKQTRGIISFR